MNRAIGLVLLTLLAGNSPAGQDGATARGSVVLLSGIPVEGARVSFYRLQFDSIRGLPSKESLVREVTSASDGRYIAEGLPWGQYRVEVELEGFGRTEVWRFYLWRDADRILDIGLPWGITHGIEGAAAIGEVRDETGRPLPDVLVTLVSAYNVSVNQQTRTDEKGSFKVEALAPGEYVLWAAKLGWRGSSISFPLRSGEKRTVRLVLEASS